MWCAWRKGANWPLLDSIDPDEDEARVKRSLYIDRRYRANYPIVEIEITQVEVRRVRRGNSAKRVNGTRAKK